MAKKPPRIKREYIRQKDGDAIVTPQQNMVTEVLNERLLYDYSKIEFTESDKEELIQYEKDILLNKARIGEIALKTGEILENARMLFDRYSDTPNSYMEWYSALGFNKDQVSFLRSRYRLTLDYPENKKMISELSDAEIKQLSNKKTPDSVVRKVITGEVRTAAGIKKAISAAVEIDKFENLRNDKDKLLSRLGELESRIPRLEEELRELKAEKEKVKEKIKYRLNNMTSVLYRIGDIYQLRFGDEYGGNHTLIPGNVVKIISERGVEKGTVILKDNGLLALRIKNDEIELHNLADNNLFHFKLVESR